MRTGPTSWSANMIPKSPILKPLHSVLSPSLLCYRWLCLGSGQISPESTRSFAAGPVRLRSSSVFSHLSHSSHNKHSGCSLPFLLSKPRPLLYLSRFLYLVHSKHPVIFRGYPIRCSGRQETETVPSPMGRRRKCLAYTISGCLSTL